MFSNLPNLVPLTATYDGPAIERSVIRTFTVVDDGSYFTQGTPTAEWDWEKKVNRIICLPMTLFPLLMKVRL